MKLKEMDFKKQISENKLCKVNTTIQIRKLNKSKRLNCKEKTLKLTSGQVKRNKRSRVAIAKNAAISKKDKSLTQRRNFIHQMSSQNQIIKLQNMEL